MADTASSIALHTHFRPASSRVYVIGVLAVSFLALLLTQGMPHAAGAVYEVGALLTGLTAIGCFAAWSRTSGLTDFFQGPNWLCSIVYVNTVGFTWLLKRNWQPHIPWVFAAPDRLLGEALIIEGVGFLAVWAGFAFSIRALPVRARRRESGRLRPGMAWLLVYLGVAAKLYGILSGSAIYLTTASAAQLLWLNYLQFVVYVGWLGKTALLVVGCRTGDRRTIRNVLAVIAFEVFLDLIIGTKGFMLAFFTVVMSVYYGKGKIDRKLIAAGAFSLLLLVPTVTGFRQLMHEAHAAGENSLAIRAASVWTAFQSSIANPGDALDSLSGTLVGRQGEMLEVTASICAIHPADRGFVWKELIQEGALLLIPRIIWRDKPSERSELYRATTTYTGAATEYSFTAIGLFGDAYRAAGYPGVTIVFLLIGYIYGAFYQRGPLTRDPRGTVLYIVVVTCLLMYESGLVDVFVRLVQVCPLLWLANHYLLFRDRPPRMWRRAG